MDIQFGFKEIASSLTEWQQIGLNEAQTTTAIVIRILYLLGYNIWDPLEVVAQESGNSGVPDFIIKVGNKRRFVIEVKKLGSALDNKTKTQAVSYANNQAIRWAILTNGNQWQFFDSFMHKEAHERRILSLSFAELDAGLLAQYFNRLLKRERWSRDDSNDGLECEAHDIHDHIQLSSELQPLASELKKTMQEYTIQDPEAGLKLIEDMERWDGKTLALVRKNKALFNQLAAFTNESNPQLVTTSSAKPSPLDVFEALRQGLMLTSPPKRAAKSSGLEAWLNGEPVEATSWRDICAGAAEALLFLGKESVLDENVLVFDTRTERKKGNKLPYPTHAYRTLSNGKYLFLHYSASAHRARSRRLLRALGLPDRCLEVHYKGKTFQLP